MKKMILMLAVVFTLPVSGQTMQDTLAIKKAVTDYIEGWATGNVERIQDAVSPELSKRRVTVSGELVFVQDMSRSSFVHQLLEMLRAFVCRI